MERMRTITQAGTWQELGVGRGSLVASERRVTLANWQDPGFNRWGFQNVRALLPTAVIRRGPEALEIPSRPVDLDDLPLEGTASTVAELLASSPIDGVVVLSGGALVYERYLNGMDPDSLHLSMSMAKSVTAFTVGTLVEEGLLDTETPIVELVPWLAGSGYEEATLQHVLDMTVALDFDETYTTGDEFLRFDAALGFRPWTWPGPALDCLTYIPGIGRASRPHGERFHYCSPNTEVLGWAIERTTGRAFADVVSERVWVPMGAGADAEITLDASGTAAADGGLCATLRDYARFGLLAARGGRASGRQVVPEAWVTDSFEGGDRDAMRRSGETAATSYRNQWWRS
jgi:CubicO group peptidase (beta-lactamase class C family)